MICKVKSTIEKHKMLEGVKTVAVGLSGGADSMCLTDILIKLKVQYDIVVKAVHINHNIRGKEAERDENHVREYCKENGIELYVFSEDIPLLSKKLGLSEEECGRKVRYECFRKANCDVIATAHTLSDSIETSVFNFIRGTGSKGLSGISAKREPNIIRPLIECSREEIEAYCFDNNIPYVTDSTNLENDYSRNYIRHIVIPAFAEINPSYASSIAKTGEILREESDFIEEEAMKLMKNSEFDGGYRKDCFIEAHPAVRKRAFRIMLEGKMTKPVEHRHIALCEDGILIKNNRIELSKDLYISFESDIIQFCTLKKADENWSAEVLNFSAETPYGRFELSKTDEGYGIDISKVKGNLVFSSKTDGDRIYLRKRKITKSLKKLFNEMKIPPEERSRIAVLRDGENVVWVEGVGIDGNYIKKADSDEVYVIIKDGLKL